MTDAGPAPRLAFGLAAGVRTWLPELGEALAALGYDEAWSNDVPGASGLETLAGLGSRAPDLRLAVGVLALSDSTPAEIASLVAASRLGADRLTVGVGTGSGRSLARTREGVAAVRALLPEHLIGLAAVGPRMAALGGEVADVVLLNWAGPRLAGERRAAIAAAAAEAGRPAPRVAAYVRVAVGPGAAHRLATEQDRYHGYGGSYRSVIDEQSARGEAPVGIAGEAEDVEAALGAYRSALDTVVVRGLPAEDTLEAWLAVAEAAIVGS
jgi:alkanesulfonate monooxygenase SsuD/methylene tetrahydromethanopterin reductase-like flavin-dependent oxidoreductase (luciferase family)